MSALSSAIPNTVGYMRIESQRQARAPVRRCPNDLFDHLVSAAEERERERNAERFGSLEVDH
jgi:hypothetical protein